jgi:hypothetical protein
MVVAAVGMEKGDGLEKMFRFKKKALLVSPSIFLVRTHSQSPSR